jgi:hypothetical protein
VTALRQRSVPIDLLSGSDHIVVVCEGITMAWPSLWRKRGAWAASRPPTRLANTCRRGQTSRRCRRALNARSTPPACRGHHLGFSSRSTSASPRAPRLCHLRLRANTASCRPARLVVSVPFTACVRKRRAAPRAVHPRSGQALAGPGVRGGGRRSGSVGGGHADVHRV